MNIQIVKKADIIPEDIQNNLIPSYEHIRLWNDYKKLRTKLENHYATLKLLTIKVFKINTSKGYHVQNKKLKFICKKGQSINQDTWFIRKLLLINLRSIEIIQRLVQENRDLQDLIDRSQEFAIQNMKTNCSDVFLEERNPEGQYRILLGNYDSELNKIVPGPYNFGGNRDRFAGGNRQCITQMLKPEKLREERNDNIQFSLNMLTMVADSLRKFANSKDHASLMTHFEAASIIDDLEISFGNFECLVIADSSNVRVDFSNPTIFQNQQGMLMSGKRIAESTSIPILRSSQNCAPIECDLISHHSPNILIQDDQDLTPFRTLDLNPFATFENNQFLALNSVTEMRDPSPRDISSFQDELPVEKNQNMPDKNFLDLREHELLPILQSEKQQRRRIHKIADEVLRSQTEFLRLYPVIECHYMNMNILNDINSIDVCLKIPNEGVCRKLAYYEAPKIIHPKEREINDSHFELAEIGREYIDIGIGDNSVLIFNRECQVDEQDYVEIIEEAIDRGPEPVRNNNKWAQKPNSNHIHERRKSVSYHDHKKSLQNLQDIIQSCKKNSTPNSHRTNLPASNYRNSENRFGPKNSTSQVPRIPKKISKKELNPRTETFWQNVKSQGSKLKQRYPGIPDMSKVCQIILQGNRSTGMSFQYVRSNRPNFQLFAINPYRAY